MNQFSLSNQNYTKQQHLRDFLELAKQRMLSRIPTNITNATNATTITTTTTSSQFSISSLSHAIERMIMNANNVEIVFGVGYILIIVAFIMKQFLKTFRRFEYHYASSNDGAYNRFGFIANEDSDSDFTSSSDYVRYSDDDENNDVIESSPSSPISLRYTLSNAAHLPLVTPLQKITTVTPQTPSPPLVRRSLRLRIKSEMNLSLTSTSTTEKQNKTNVVTRSQTKQRNQSQNRNTNNINNTNNTNERLSISSEPIPSLSSSFNRNHGSSTTPSLHPENDEELAYYLQRCYERKMKKRSEFNSPLVVRRLVL